MSLQFRQGDVLLEYVGDNALLSAAQPVTRDDARVVLAYGEQTGHAHAIADPNAELFTNNAGERWLVIRPGEPRLRTIRIEPGYQPPCEVVEGPVRLPDHAGLLQVTVRTSGVVLEHEEHGAIVLEQPGVYRLPGQREYAGEQARLVAD